MKERERERERKREREREPTSVVTWFICVRGESQLLKTASYKKFTKICRKTSSCQSYEITLYYIIVS